MKKSALAFVLLVLVGIALFAWLRPANHDETRAEPATEVAVHVAQVKRATLRAYVTAYGRVDPEPTGERPAASALIAPAVPGVVTAVRASEGQRVKKGDLLFQLDSRAADVAVEFAEKTLDREKQLLQIEGTSEQRLQQAEQQLDAARVQQAWLRVRSPLAGTVTRIGVMPGQAVDLATTMAEIVDLDRLVVSASVPSAELSQLEIGQVAELTAAGTDTPVAGRLDFVSPSVDVQTGTASVRARLPAGSGLRPGQFVALRIVSAVRENRVAVPIESVVRNNQGEDVVAIVVNGTATQMRVTVGLKDGRLVEVAADGLQAGMAVVTDGAFALPAETRVRVVEN